MTTSSKTSYLDDPSDEDGNEVQENVKYQQSLFSLKGYGWQCMGQQVINASNTSYNASREDNLFLTLKRKDICK